MKILLKHIETIKEICKQYNVKALFVFGSLVKDTLTSDSDIDFIVEIENDNPLEYAEKYFALKFTLEKLFNRKIDLLEKKAITNRYMQEEIEKTKVLVYGN